MSWGSWYLHRSVYSGSPAWPGWIVTPIETEAPRVPVPDGRPAFPDVARSPKVNQSQFVLISCSPQIADAVMPGGFAPVYPSSALGRNMNQDHTWVINAPAGAFVAQVPIRAVFPNQTPGRELSPAALVNFNQYPQIPDAAQASGVPSWPSLTPGPRRAPSYTITVTPQIPDRLMPAASPSYPGSAPTARRLPDYTWVSMQPLTLTLTTATAFPFVSDVSRGKEMGQAALVEFNRHPQISDAAAPVGVAVYPSSAPGPKRALNYTIVAAPQIGDAVQPSGTQAWKSTILPARRSLDYTVTVSLEPGDAVEPAAPSFPAFAAGPRRLPATAYHVQLMFHPGFVDAVPVASVWPNQAPAARRAPVSAYVGPFPAAFPAPSINLGRFRLGDVVSTAYANWLHSFPPTAVYTGPQGIVVSPQLHTRDQVNWANHQLLDIRFPLGSYTILVGGTNTYSFTLVAGGDPTGAIISVFGTKSVQGKQMIAHTRSGEIYLGTNPRFP